jgi:alpha-galactosidase
MGQMSDAPLGAIVETYAQFRRDSIRPVTAKPLPAGVSEAVRRVISVQEMTLKAAMNGDKALAFEAMLNDPLVRIPTDKAWKMFNEMLQYTNEHVRVMK